MDPITIAITAALVAGTASGVTKVGEQVVADAYAELKKLLAKKLGAKSKVVKAVMELETNPKSEARKAVLNEEVTAARADQDKDLLKAAQSLLKAIKAKPGGEQIIQILMGDQNIQIAGNENVVSVNTPKRKR